MTLALILLTIAVAGLATAVALNHIGGGMPAAESNLPPVGLPAGAVQPGDVARLRLAPALRGYRMDQVDEVLARLAEELAARDAEIEELRGGGISDGADAYGDMSYAGRHGDTWGDAHNSNDGYGARSASADADLDGEWPATRRSDD